MATSEAKAKVSLDAAPFEKGAKAITNAAKAMSAAVATAMATAGAAIVAVLGAKSLGAIANSAREVLDLGESMANAGKMAGIAAGQFYLFNAAVEKGVSRKTMAGMIGENAEVLNRSASVFRDVSIKLWAAGEKIRGFWLGLMDRLAPVLSKLLDGALAHNLVSAGQAFGGAISDALSTVYQLAKDGKLWDTFKKGFQIAFDYAGERLQWLAKLGGELFSVVGESLGEALKNGFFVAWKAIKQEYSRFMNTMEAKLVRLGLMSQETASANIVQRQLDISATGEPKGDKESFVDKLKGIISKNEFKPSNKLQKNIEDFSAAVGGALTKYNEETSPGEAGAPIEIENNSRRAAFGADSLASIGGGGGVYLGLSVLDIQKSQLSELRSINAGISSLTSGGLTTGGLSSPTLTDKKDWVSRFQRKTPVEN